MSKPRSNSRRFVNAAWSLLTFQLVASAGAVAVTGVAAFHVSNLVNGPQVLGPVDEAVATQDEAALDAPPAATPDNSIPTAPAAPAGPVNDGAGALTLVSDERGNINASLSDPDGLSSTPQIQWFRRGALVPNAGGPTYTIRLDDSQAAITARATYVDGDGFSESVVSQPFQVGVIIP
jgi:hypothetical protein